MSQLSQADSRKLRAIYTALDAHNNKQALKLIKAFQERHGATPLGVALSIIAYEREGRTAEAGAALDRFLALKPRELNVIQTAAPALKALGRHDDLITLWTNAAEADPTNEELQVQIFLAHGRSNSHGKQYQLASGLYKTFKRPRYLFWMAGAAYLQWRASNGRDALQLTLAEKWAAKATEESAALPAADAPSPTLQLEAVLFTVELQEAAAKLDAALATLAAHAALFRSEPALPLRLRASLLTRLGRHAEALEAQRRILAEAADDWDAAVALAAHAPAAGKEREQEEELRAYFAALVERAPDARRRGPLLAAVLVHVTALERRSPDAAAAPSSAAALCAALRAYLAHVGDRPCVLADLSPLVTRAVAALPAAELPALVAALATTAGAAAAELGQLVPLPLAALPPALQPAPRSLAAARRLLSEYLAAPANERHLHISALLNAIVAATAAHEAEPIARVTILLMKLYQVAGAGPQAAQQAAALSPKHIQWLTLPYLFLDESVDLAVPAAAAADAFRGVAKFMADARRDMPDLAVLPFRHDSLSKLREFARMREKLDRALAGPEAALDAALLALSETPALGPASVMLQTSAPFAAPLSAAHVATLEVHSDRSVLAALSPLAGEQAALLAARHSAPEAWRRAVLVSRSLVGPLFRLLSLTPTAEQLTQLRAEAAAALASAEAAIAPTPALQAHPLQRGVRAVVQLIDLSLMMLAAKEEETDEALSSALNALHESQAAGLAAWQAAHGWWSGERLGAARRWQAEECAWAVLALQCWLRLVPRKAKGARAALRRAHAATQERLAKAAEATQWVEWRAGLGGVDKEAAQVAAAVEGAQKSALSVLRNAFAAMRAALQEAKP